MICHPDCLSDSLVEMPKIVRKIINSVDMHEEILAWQDRALREDFVRRPIAILEQAIHSKAGVATGPAQIPAGLRRGVA
jgi:hypothetical protein